MPPAGPARLLTGVAALAALGVAAMALASPGEPYYVSVPVTLVPDDPALWAVMTADDAAAARALDPTLPDVDPLAPGMIDGSATDGPPLDLTALKEQAFIGPPARPMVFRAASPVSAARAHYCLTATLYYEAASESDDGMRGVAQVVLNRVRHPSFPNTVCGVVFQGSQRALVCQFTFSCDGSMARRPAADQWRRASRIAAAALAGATYPGVGLATHYHTLAVNPGWRGSLVMTNVVGAHIFHRWRGRWGMPAAFSAPYLGIEPAPGPYLPIAAQLAARAGRPLVAGMDTAVTIPAGAGVGQMPGGTGAVAAIPPATAPLSAPRTASAMMPDAATATTVPGSAVAATQPAPDYVDPRLTQSGDVVDRYKDSGTIIR